MHMVQNAVDLPGHHSQRFLGLFLATLVSVAWLSLHFYSMFIFDLSITVWPQVLVIAVVQCWLSVGIFIVCHDAMHGSLAPGWDRVNSLLGGTLIFLYAGFSWSKIRQAHFDHHKFTGSDNDPDFDTAHPNRFWPWYGTFFKRYFGLRSLIYVHSVVGIYLFVFDISFLKIFLLYGIPALFSSLQLFYFGTYRPHRQTQNFVDRHNARSDNFSVLVSLASCFHFGYHLEHHRRPDVPWWSLPRARRAGVGL